MFVQRSVYTLFLVVLIMGCSSPFIPQEGDPNRDGDSLRPCRIKEQMGSDFEKPSDAYEYSRRFVESVNREWDKLQVRRYLWNRPYMPSPANRGSAWLHKGETFALDGALSISGEEAPETTRIAVKAFVDFEPVEFQLDHVTKEGAWTKRENFSEQGASKTQFIEVVRGEPFNFTLYIPPAKIGEKGAHDIRIAFLSRLSMTQDERYRIRELFSSNRGYTLYYGGYEPAKELSAFPNAEKVSASDELLSNLRYTPGVFLFPAVESETVRNVEIEKKNDLGLLEPYQVSSDVVKFESAVTTASSFPSPVDRYIVAMHQHEKIQGASGFVPYKGNEVDEISYVNNLPFEVNLDENGGNRIQLLSFPEPYCNWAKADVTAEGAVSNLINLERSE